MINRVAGWTIFLIYLAIGLLGVAVAIEILRMLAIKDPAAWVQAVGSVLAIAAAVRINYIQQKNIERREQRKTFEENRNTVQALRDELEVMSAGFEANVGKVLRDIKRGEMLLIEWNPAERPFVVYDACASQLGKIDDDSLRKNIITAFAQARGMVLSIRTNARLIEKLEAANARPSEAPDVRRQNDISDCERALKGYAMRLKLAYARANATEIEFHAAVEKYLEKGFVE